MSDSCCGPKSLPDLHSAFGVWRPKAFGAMIGGARLLGRCWWLVPLAAVVGLPFELMAWWASCTGGGVCDNPNQINTLVSMGLSGSRVPLWTWPARAFFESLAQFIVVAVTVAVLAYRCAGLRLNSARIIRLGGWTAPRLAAVVIVFSGVPALVTILLGNAFIDAAIRALHGMVAQALNGIFGDSPLREIISGVPLSSGGGDAAGTSHALVLATVLGLAFIVVAVLAIILGLVGAYAVVPLVIEWATITQSVTRMFRLGLSQVAGTIGTGFFFIVFPWLVKVIVGLGAGSSPHPWWETALIATGTGALSLPAGAAAFFVRYLDLRRLQGDRLEDLVHDLRPEAPG